MKAPRPGPDLRTSRDSLYDTAQSHIGCSLHLLTLPQAHCALSSTPWLSTHPAQPPTVAAL
jgi:hypothetical protein